MASFKADKIWIPVQNSSDATMQRSVLATLTTRILVVIGFAGMPQKIRLFGQWRLEVTD